MNPVPLPSARASTGKRRSRGFGKGAAVGLAVVIPLISLGIWAASRLGAGAERPSMIEIIRLVVVFAGIPAIVTTGGVGRLAAQASDDRGRRRAIWVAARALAMGGAAVMIVAVIPAGVIPAGPWGWVALGAVGAAIGAFAGVLLGLACSGEMPTLVELGVWPADQVGRTFEKVGRAVRRRRETAAGERPDRT